VFFLHRYLFCDAIQTNPNSVPCYCFTKTKCHNFSLKSIRLLTVYFRYVYFPAARVVQDDDVCSNAVTITQRKMSKSRFTDVITSCRLMIIVALIGSYDNCNYCRAVQSVTAADYLPYVRQDDFRPRDGGVDDFRPDRLHYGGSFAIPVVDNGNRTHVQRLLLRTSDMASKFLPFVTSADVHTQCYKHTAVYLTQLNDFQLWATQSEQKRTKIN